MIPGARSDARWLPTATADLTIHHWRGALHASEEDERHVTAKIAGLETTLDRLETKVDRVDASAQRLELGFIRLESMLAGLAVLK